MNTGTTHQNQGIRVHSVQPTTNGHQTLKFILKKRKAVRRVEGLLVGNIGLHGLKAVVTDDLTHQHSLRVLISELSKSGQKL